MNRTSSVPKSVLLYELDKGKHFDPETFILQVKTMTISNPYLRFRRSAIF